MIQTCSRIETHLGPVLIIRVGQFVVGRILEIPNGWRLISLAEEEFTTKTEEFHDYTLLISTINQRLSSCHPSSKVSP